MSRIPGSTLYHVPHLQNAEKLASKLLQLATQLLADGIVHGDLNEFNVMVTPSEDVFLIDFPQVVMASHAQALKMFARDVECISEYFGRKYGVVCELPTFTPPYDATTNFDREYQRFNSARPAPLQLARNWLHSTTQGVLDAWHEGQNASGESDGDDDGDDDDGAQSSDTGEDGADISVQQMDSASGSQSTTSTALDDGWTQWNQRTAVHAGDDVGTPAQRTETADCSQPASTVPQDFLRSESPSDRKADECDFGLQLALELTSSRELCAGTVEDRKPTLERARNQVIRELRR
uniref:non-specific serine/threonine protein kinase n=2 Tax=Lygus hesperus TaxID=30085 RepID=A0A0A9YL18_LYGHE